MSYTADEKREALLKLADFLEELPEEKYNQRYFGTLEGDCQTPGCALGWYVHNNPAEPLGLYADPCNTLDDKVLLYPWINGDAMGGNPNAVLEEYFNDVLANDSINHLFLNTIPRTSKKQAGLIREVLADGS